MSEFAYFLASGSPANYVLTSNSETLKVGFVVVSQQKPEDQTSNGAGQNRTRDKSGAISRKVTSRLRSGEDLLAQAAALPAQDLSKVHLTFDDTGGNRIAPAVASLQENTLSRRPLPWPDARHNSSGVYAGSAGTPPFPEALSRSSLTSQAPDLPTTCGEGNDLCRPVGRDIMYIYVYIKRLSHGQTTFNHGGAQ